ncbi:hypothetical protein [Candidatus Protochlamydia phocaeensis]|uniref:hypothetical protein n=1 Tax=Candidatus Protochlamydia phocaeensis TaxID=1414722 RepID=UPI0008381EBE|nr:hypothetical protein [Candidatus Protochlamydia phocaeensis]
MNVGINSFTNVYTQQIQYYSKQLQSYDSNEALGQMEGIVTSFVKMDAYHAIPFYTFYPVNIKLISKKVSALNLIEQNLVVLEEELIKVQELYFKAQADQTYISLMQKIQELKALQANYVAIFKGHLKKAQEYQGKSYEYQPKFGMPKKPADIPPSF